MEWSLASLVVLPIGLGLLGFVEPCSIGSLSRRLPVWTGLLLMVLGLWSIWFGVFARIEA